MKRALLAGCARLSNTGEYSAQPSGLAPRLSRRSLRTVARRGDLVEDALHDRPHGLLDRARRRAGDDRAGGTREVEQVRALGLVELSARASPSSTSSETPLMLPRSRRL